MVTTPGSGLVTEAYRRQMVTNTRHSTALGRGALDCLPQALHRPPHVRPKLSGAIHRPPQAAGGQPLTSSQVVHPKLLWGLRPKLPRAVHVSAPKLSAGRPPPAFGVGQLDHSGLELGRSVVMAV